jgi:flavodoxin
MKSLVIYDSKYGNTKLIAEEIAEVLREHGEVNMVRAADANSDMFNGIDLLAMGGPTIAHGLSPEMKGLLESAELFPPMAQRPMALAFDTRINWPKLLSGSAADKIARLLGEMGCPMLAEPGSFIVTGGEGPLAEGEKERALDWVRSAMTHMSTLTTAGV